MKETGKASLRRIRDSDFAIRYLVGDGLDICGGADPLGLYGELFPAMKSIRAWNGIDGDAQNLTGLADNTFDFVHACHALQRMADPAEAIRHWFRVLKPSGHLVILVPDEDMYEQGMWPSQRHHDNRWTCTVFKTKSWSPVSINLLDLVRLLGVQADLRRMEVIDAGFRHRLPRFDQTLTPVGECAVEMVIRKRPQRECTAGGRLNPDGTPGPDDIFLLTGFRPRPAGG